MSAIKKRLLIAIIGAASLLVSASPASATAAAVAGVAYITPPGCSDASHLMPIEGVTDGGGVWVFTRAASAATGCPSILYGAAMSFVDRWDPSRGGCLSGFTHVGTRLCVGALDAGRVTRTSVSICFSTGASTCWNGEGTFARP